jgi:hypothetical protein
MPEELPRSPPPFPIDTIPCKAYNRCLDFESRPGASNSTSRLSPLVCSRILGYMLIHAPGETGRVWLSEQIIKCGDDGALKQLGEFFCDHFIRVCEYLTKSCVQSSCLHLESAVKSAKGPTPTPSLHSSDSAFEQVQQILQGVLQVTPRDQRTAKAQVSTPHSVILGQFLISFRPSSATTTAAFSPDSVIRTYVENIPR